MHFDKAHNYDKNDLKPQDFADHKWYKKDDKLFTNPIDIIDTSKPFLSLALFLKTILQLTSILIIHIIHHLF